MQIREYLDLIISGEINKKDFPKIRDEWKRLLEGKDVNADIVPREIINSWHRSRVNGIDPYDVNSYQADSSKKKEVERFKVILSDYSFFFKNAMEIAGQNEFSFSLRTVDGLGQVISNKIGLSFPSFIGICSEKTVGVSAASIANRENIPMVILEPYLYRQDYFKNINQAAAPIHNEKNEVIGSLGLSFFYPEQAVKAYYLISLIAKTFDSLYLPLTLGHEKQIQQIIDSLPQGIAYINEKDTRKYYNKKLLDLMDVNRKLDIENKLNKYISVSGNTKFKSKDVNVNIDGKEVKTQLTFNKITDDITDQAYKLIQLHQPDQYITRSLQCEEMFTFDQIVGNCPAIKEAKAIALKVAKTSVPIMIHGESGTGKEMFAQAIHSASPRCDQPFIAINCGAIPGELVESELFGYEEGSFTGAVKGGKTGKIEAASGGTLFLDEIESMPLKDQIKLLRVLSTGKVQKIGSTKERCVDIRLVSATKTDLLRLADEDLFREDLFFRISTIIINLPPLRGRKEDIVLLAGEFVNKISEKYNLLNIEMDQVFINALCSYHWRGNVRELEHTIERSLIMLGNEQILSLNHLPNKVQESYREKATKDIVKEAIEQSESKQGLLALSQKMVIEHVLESVNGNVSAAAELLGINRRTIYNKLQENNNLRIIR